MIDYIKENYLWLSAIVVPIVVALIGAFKKTSRNQKIRDVKGDGNMFINGDVR